MSLPVVELSQSWTVVVDILVWAVGGTLIGYGAYRVAVRRFDHDTWLTRPRAFERGGAFYVERLRIKRWKARLPEAGSLFGEGFNKRHLDVAGFDDGGATYYERFLAETRRAEVTHWLVAALGPWFVLWNPWWLAAVMVIYGVVANVPCIAIQRYNRARLQRVVERRRRAAPGRT